MFETRKTLTSLSSKIKLPCNSIFSRLNLDFIPILPKRYRYTFTSLIAHHDLFNKIYRFSGGSNRTTCIRRQCRSCNSHVQVQQA